jgi:hypothetical protein
MNSMRAVLGVAIVLASIIPASAKVKFDRKCFREAFTAGYGFHFAVAACKRDIGPCEGTGTEGPRKQANAKRGLCVSE